MLYCSGSQPFFSWAPPTYTYSNLYCQHECSLGIEPTTFALPTQCSTTEPQEHTHTRARTHTHTRNNCIIFCLLEMHI